MKTTSILFFFLLIIFVVSVNAQKGINYKAIINNSDGNVLANTAITVQFTILQDGTTPVYSETHTKTTDANGIIIVNIGEGSSSDDFNNIDWGSASHYLKTEIDKGEGFVDMGTAEFKVVPYALYADKVGDKDDADADPTNELQTLSIDGYTLTLSDGGSVTLPTNTTSGGQYYFGDKDGDNYGDKFMPVWVPEGVIAPAYFVDNNGDCDDGNVNINPGATEIPGDGIDQDCDGIDIVPDPSLDIDDDGDGFSENQGDCDDTNAEINPEAVEICDGIDNSCNTYIDQADVPNSTLCPPTENVLSAVCGGALGCQITECYQGWVDLDGIYENGCECLQDEYDGLELPVGNECGTAVDLGIIANDPGGSIIFGGNCAVKGDNDWYRFRIDGICREDCSGITAIDIAFAQNPTNNYRMDIWGRGCPGSNGIVYEGISTYATYKCPDLIHNLECHESFWIRVYRADGSATCNSYQIQITTGSQVP